MRQGYPSRPHRERHLRDDAGSATWIIGCVADRRQPAAADDGPLRKLAGALAGALIGAENPSGAIYGLIVIGALMAAESGRHESWLDTLLSAAIAALLYWVAHGYANALGARLAGRERLTPRVLVRSLRRDLSLVRGAAVPLVALVVAGAAGAAQEAAVSVAIWSAAISLAAFELLAGIRSGASRSELALETAVGAAMGVAVLLLRIVLH